MDAATAFQTVIDLAKENVLSEDMVRDNPDLKQEHVNQLEALRIVEDIAVNQFGDD